MRKNMVTILYGIAILVNSLCLSTAAHATLIGDTVTMGHFFPTSTSSGVGTCPDNCGGLTDVFVQAGTGDVTEPYFPGGNTYEVDMEANSFSVLYNSASNWSSATFNGLIISDLDWIGTPGIITDLNITTNLVGFDNSRVTFTNDSVSINWEGLSFAAGTSWDISLVTTHVPEPTTLLLMGLGLAGLGFSRTRKMA